MKQLGSRPLPWQKKLIPTQSQPPPETYPVLRDLGFPELSLPQNCKDVVVLVVLATGKCTHRCLVYPSMGLFFFSKTFKNCYYVNRQSLLDQLSSRFGLSRSVCALRNMEILAKSCFTPGHSGDLGIP